MTMTNRRSSAEILADCFIDELYRRGQNVHQMNRPSIEPRADGVYRALVHRPNSDFAEYIDIGFDVATKTVSAAIYHRVGTHDGRPVKIEVCLAEADGYDILADVFHFYI